MNIGDGGKRPRNHFSLSRRCSSTSRLQTPHNIQKNNLWKIFHVGMLLLVGCSTKAQAWYGVGSTTIDGISYNLASRDAEHTDVEAYVSACSPNVTDARIQSHIFYSGKTCPVTSIGRFGNAFQNCTNLKSVTIPNTVKDISTGAFSNCTGLVSVTIPESVTEIGWNAFWGCGGLQSVTVLGNVAWKSTHSYPFSACPNLQTVVFGNKVTTIKPLFHGCSGLKSVTIPDSVTNIEWGAFAYCKGLESVIIPNSVTRIGEEAFWGCNALTRITIPPCVTCINSWTFGNCSNLTNVTIPSSVTNIGYEAFLNCRGLMHVSIPNNVTQIEREAFSGCSSLTSVTIPGSVTSIGTWAFHDCDSLTNATILGNVTNNFIGNNGADGLFDGCHALQTVVLGDKMTKIGDFMFDGCSGLTSVTIPDNITSIGAHAFHNCTSLSHVTLLGNVTNNYNYGYYSGRFPFDGCSALKTVVLGDKMTQIGAYMFCGCSGLTSVVIPDSVTNIREGAFSGCSGLTHVTIPSSVTEMWRDAFKDCHELKYVWFEGRPPLSVNGYSIFDVMDGAKGYYTAEHANEWQAVIGRTGKWDRLIMVPLEELAPPELQVESADPMKGSIKLVWTDAGAGSGVTYSIYRGAGESRAEAVCVANGLTGNSWEDENYWTAEPALKPLNYWVVANDSEGGERESKPVQTRRRFGVFVGLSEFAPERKEMRFSAPAKEAEELRNLFVDHGGILETNAVLMTNSNANWGAVSRSIAAKAKDSQPGDLFVFYVATHGMYSGGKGKLLFYDCLVPMEEFFSVLGEFNSGTVVIPVLMACHSGAFVDYANGGSTLVDTSEGFKAFVSNGLAMCRANMPVLASCGAEEGSDDAGTYTDFGEAFILEGWRNGYADGEVHGVGYGGGNGDGYVSFLELIQYAKAFARGRTDAYRAHVQWSSDPVEYEWLLRDTLAGQVPQGGTHPGVPDIPAVSAAWQIEEQVSNQFGAFLFGLCADNAKRYWCYVLKEGRNVYSEDEDDWECVDYRGVKAPNSDKFYCRSRSVLLGGIDRYRVRAVNGAGASGFSEVVELNDGDMMNFVQMTLAGPGQLTFRWKALCEEGGLHSSESEAELWVRDSEGVNARKALLSEVAEWKTVGPVNFRSNCEYPLQWVRTGNYPVQVELLEWKQTKSAAMGGATWQYTDDGEESTVMGGEVEGDVEIPAELEGMTVTAVGSWAFAEQVSLFALAVPDCVESIGDGAFSGCSGLASVDLGNGVSSIGDGAFAGCASLTTLAIPASVTSLGSQVFEGCNSLATLHVPAAWEGTDMLAGAGVPEGCEVVYGAPPKPDLGFWQPEGWPAEVFLARSVDGLEAATEFAAGEEFYLCCGLRNSGDMDAENCRAAVRVADSAGNEVASWSFPPFGLNAGVFVWARAANLMEDGTGLASIEEPGEYTLELMLDPEDQLDESDESDNCWFLTFRVLSPVSQRVTFAAHGGSGVAETMDFAFGGRYDGLPTPKCSGHAFLGWFTAAQGGTEVTDGDWVTPAAARTLHAHWTDRQVTTFSGNGGSPKSQKTTNTIAAAYGALPTAQRVGHAFLGWYTAAEGGTRISANTPVKAVATRTFYAHWTTNQVATFKGNGGSPGTQKTTNTIGAVFGTLPEVAWANHVFLGWYTEAEGGSRITTNSTVKTMASRTFYAHWTDKQGVTFKGNGGTPETLKTTNTMGVAYGTLPTPSRDGHAFLGWFTAANGGVEVKGTDKATAATSRTLWAHWTDKQVTTFSGNGGSPKSQKTTNTIAAAYGALPTAQRVGHAFLGWYTAAEGGTRISANTPVKAVATRTFYAHWTDQAVTTFKGNGGKPATQKTTNTIGTVFGTLPEVSWTNHVFLGWYTEAEGGSRITTNSTVKTMATRTFYAHWTDKQVVTFKGNRGTPETQKTTNTMGKAYGTLPTPNRDGHAFLGWFTAAEGGVEVKGTDKATAATSRTLWAHWTDRQVTTFDGNGGSPKSQKTTNTIAAAFGTLPTAQRAKHAFLGWYTAAEGGTRISTNTPVKAVATRTFYAHWTTNQVATFKGNGGKPGTQKTTNTIGTVFGTLPEVAWTNHVFLGWYTEAEGGSRISTNSTVKTMAARTFWAHWTDKQVVTFNGNGGTPETLKTTNTMGVAYGALPTPKRDGQAFLGWFTAANGGVEVKGTDKATAATSRTLWAHWTDKQVATFSGNGGSPKSQKTTNTIAAAFGTLPTAQKARHAFLGWYTAAEGGTRISTNTPVKAVATRTFYAHWTTNQVATFKGNGGSPGTQKTTNTIGAVFGTLPEVAWANHVFLGWYTEAEGGSRITTNSTVKTMAARTFWAHWAAARELAILGLDAVPGPAARAAGARTGEGQRFNIRFDATAGVEYEILWTPSLSGAWEVLRTFRAKADGEAEIPVLLPEDASSGFFRLSAPGN